MGILVILLCLTPEQIGKDSMWVQSSVSTIFWFQFPFRTPGSTPSLGLAFALIVETIHNLSVNFPTFHFEYPSVLSRCA